tara:strand:- start:9 stop:245 length:237 start_codon:yes stop_codon:yes gene_type:complete
MTKELTIIQCIESLARRAENIETTDGSEAMRLSQSAANLASALNNLVSLPAGYEAYPENQSLTGPVYYDPVKMEYVLR